VEDISITTVPVCYSDDDGTTWTMKFLFDSSEFPEGSGVLYRPVIVYDSAADEFFWQAIDPYAAMYNEEMAWIPGDIVGADECLWYGISGSDSSDYIEGTIMYVGEWFVGLSIETTMGFVQIPGLIYLWHDKSTDAILMPSEYNPEWAWGFYYDGQSILETGPALAPSMAAGADRMYMIMERENETAGRTDLAFKATVTDLDPESDTFLYTLGGGPGDMDKYADIEVWPWQQYLIEDATDPYIVASGSNVAVFYMQGGSVYCKYSDDSGDTWDISEVAQSAGYPAAWMSGDVISCVYVQDGNLFKIMSSDGGATWGTPEQVNDVAGTVVAESRTADIDIGGIAWTDSRNGKFDIYFEAIERQYPLRPERPDGPEEVKAGTEAEYTTTTTDPQDDDVYYMWDWGDGNMSDWLGPFNSGDTASATYTWEIRGNYEIKVKAKDEHGNENPDWSDSLLISVPKDNAVSTPTFREFLRTLLDRIFGLDMVPLIQILLG
jgi:hypothetical protein